ncbi:MAG: SDR family NAD(P)-dependent oxidoreductase [Planctomycetes bacterium]|nr:SDR family NAD(P)-dependent oxidoreductase [Planctomycetota bacterium]
MSATNPPLRRRALVTGASSGIGAATARLLVREGYRVALLARDEIRLRRLAQELEPAPSAGEPRTLVLPCDVREPERLERAFHELDRAFGGLDLLVNNAGLGYRARVAELEPALLRQTFETNVLGVLLACRSALPLLRKSERAVVVNVASVVGRRGIPGQAAYSASKAAVVSIGEALRLEWRADRIAVCTLNPGLTATGFFEAQPNPSRLAPPDLRDADPAERVARAVLELDRQPRAELSLRRKWAWLALLSQLAPRLGDRVLARRLGGDWDRHAT